MIIVKSAPTVFLMHLSPVPSTKLKRAFSHLPIHLYLHPENARSELPGHCQIHVIISMLYRLIDWIARESERAARRRRPVRAPSRDSTQRLANSAQISCVLWVESSRAVVWRPVRMDPLRPQRRIYVDSRSQLGSPQAPALGAPSAASTWRPRVKKLAV